MTTLTSLIPTVLAQDAIPNVTPQVGPFGSAYATGITLLGVAAMAGMLYAVFRAISASSRIKIGKKNHNAADAEEARGDLISAWVAIVLLGSVSALATIIYTLRLT